MVEENRSQDFILKNRDEIINCFPKEIEQKELIIRKHKKVCLTLIYFKHFLTLASRLTWFISISAFASWYSYMNYLFCKRIKEA